MKKIIIGIIGAMAIGAIAGEDINELKTKAREGDVYSMYKLAEWYESGGNGMKNKQEAITWYNKAADKGCGPALFKLGQMYENGDGVKKNNTKALDYYTQAKTAGYAQAEAAIANLQREKISGKSHKTTSQKTASKKSGLRA